MIDKIDKALEENGTPYKGMTPIEKQEMDRNSNGFLRLLQPSFGYNQYAGTVDPETVRRRRAANKRAKQNRRVNRKKK